MLISSPPSLFVAPNAIGGSCGLIEIKAPAHGLPFPRSPPEGQRQALCVACRFARQNWLFGQPGGEAGYPPQNPARGSYVRRT
jgi:hypothetical protein